LDDEGHISRERKGAVCDRGEGYRQGREEGGLAITQKENRVNRAIQATLEGEGGKRDNSRGLRKKNFPVNKNSRLSRIKKRIANKEGKDAIIQGRKSPAWSSSSSLLNGRTWVWETPSTE